MNKNQTNGFTLIELMITIAILGIVLMVGIPSFSSSIKKNSVASTINDLQSALTEARNEAVTRGITVSMCSSNDQASCSGAWEDGWILFSDKNKDGTIDVGDSDELILVTGAVKGDNDVRLVAAATGMIQYESTGYSNQSGVFIACPSDQDTEYSRALIVGSSGLVRNSHDTDGNGIYEDNSGTDLTCP